MALPGSASLPRIRNVILVHGAFADASGFRALDGLLAARGLKVILVQEPETSLAAGLATTRRALHQLEGPCVLVRHCWGSQVTSETGEYPNVKAKRSRRYYPDARPKRSSGHRVKTRQRRRIASGRTRTSTCAAQARVVHDPRVRLPRGDARCASCGTAC